MRAHLATSCVILLASVAGCGGSGGGGNNGNLFEGPLMFVGTQLEVYGPGFRHQIVDLNDDGLGELVYISEVEDDSGLSLIVGMGDENHLFGDQEALGPAEDLAMADFNADGLVDIAVIVPVTVRGEDFDRDVEIFFCQEDGSFDASGPLGFREQIESMRLIAAGDVNGDDEPDILLAGDGPALLLLISAGDSFEATPIEADFDLFITDIRIADVNDDGFGDLIVGGIGDSRQDQIILLLSVGDGNFDEPQVVVPFNRSALMDPADFNNDGFGDFAAATFPNSGIEIYLGDADGAYGAPMVTDLPASLEFYGLVGAGDFDEDGRLDMIVFDSSDTPAPDDDAQLFFLAFGLGDGRFNPALELFAETEGFPIGIADVDGDGHLDILSTVPDTPLFAVLFGNGDGKFQSNDALEVPLGSVSSLVPVYGDSWRAPDLDQDGNPDVVTASLGDEIVTFHYGSGSGTFVQESLSWPANGRIDEASFLADLDDDGDLDIIGGSEVNGNATIIRNDENRTMVALPLVQGASNLIEFIGDIDLDGNTDILFNGITARVLYGVGELEFESVAVITNDPARNWRHAGDVNGDGIVDLIAPIESGGLTVWPGMGNRTFGSPVSALDGVEGGSPRAVVLAPLNNDDRLDAVGFVGADGDVPARIAVAFGQPNSTFAEMQSFFLEDGISFGVCRDADLDTDGDTDALCHVYPDDLDESGAKALALINDGTGTFSLASYFNSFAFGELSNAFDEFGLIDLSGDDLPDIVRANDETGFSTAIGSGDGTFSPTHYFSTGIQLQAVIGDFDDDGDGDVAGIGEDGDDDALFLMENRMNGH